MLHGRFAAAFAGVVVGAVGLSAIGFAVSPDAGSPPRAQPPPAPAQAYDQHVRSARTFPESSWGTAIEMGKNPDGSCRAEGPCMMQVVLGPVSDARRRYEISFTKGQAFVTSVLVTRERDLPGTLALPDASLQGQRIASCGVHLQGEGVNAIVISRKSCLPSSAARGATAWARFENLTPYVRVVRFLFTQEPLRHHRRLQKRG